MTKINIYVKDCNNIKLNCCFFILKFCIAIQIVRLVIYHENSVY